MEAGVVYSVIGLALAFDFVNGFHDAANSIATVVSTRVLSPRWAVGWAAFFNFIAFLFFGLHVAETIGKGVVDPTSVTVPVITAALLGAIAWNLITWCYGIPSSSSHALVGGLAGAAIQHAGFAAVVLPGIVKISIFIILAPLIGLAIGFALMVATYWTFRRATHARVGKLFRALQLCSAAAYSLGHGGNDAQKTMGVILVLLIAGNMVDVKSEVPLWVVLASHTAMGLGTLAGGWRIVKTMGQKICKIQPVQGFCAESAGAFMLYFATWAGIPVSTTHTITGAIVGVGATRGLHAVKWGVARRVVWAWILTIPCSALLAMLSEGLFDLIGWR
ncbi:MAG: inorganic phosphate transporter [Deltaproteobacteria bacterium]|nr:inorganic phosphate transporter [Deltaproteobacteria bacterium]MBI2231989.1 inorganic phosphate transporter [Deltaproteobacteria bacterium]MBI2364026.1 inorganic phosphate transporter [Deltaproteobacteria bacterium]